MTRAILQSCLRFRVLVVAVAVALTGIGVSAVRAMPVDVLPDFMPPYVEIQTEALGLSAVEVEQLITAPMEADLLNGVAWLEEIRSESVPGLSSIVLVFEPGTDVLDARQMVQERLVGVGALPHVSRSPVMLQPLSSQSRLQLVGLSTTDDQDLIDLSVLARWKIKPKLMGVPGVANVAIWGQRERQLQVQVDPEVLRAQQVTLNQVIETTGNALWVSPLSWLEASTPGKGGFLDGPNQRLGVQHVLPITTAEDLSQVVVEGVPPERGLRLADVATVVEDHQPLIGDALVEDSPNLVLVVEKFPGQGTPEVTAAVEQALAEMAPGLPGVVVDTDLFRPATLVERALDSLAARLVVGLVLAAVLVGVLLSWRSAVVVLVTVPAALVAALTVLDLRGATANSLVLAGLLVALVAVVDDAVVGADAVRRRPDGAPLDPARGGSGPGDGAPDRESGALRALLAARGTLVYATVVALVVVVPLVVLSGVTGALTRALVAAHVLALVASFVVALTLAPALALLLGRGRAERGTAAAGRRAALSAAVGARLRRAHAAGLVRTAIRPVAVLAVAGLVAVAGLAALPVAVGGDLLPRLQDRDLVVTWEGAPGTSRTEMNRVLGQAGAELRALPEVRTVAAHVGRAVTSDQVVGVSSGELWVGLHEDADHGAAVAAVTEVVEGYPGSRHEVLTYPEQQVRAARGDADSDVAVRVFGVDTVPLERTAGQVAEVLAGVDGVVDPRVLVPPVEPVVEVEVDLDRAEVAGIKPGDVRRAATTLVQGVEVGNLFEEQKVFEVVVTGLPGVRSSLTSVEEMLVDTPTGGHVRLGEVADVRVTPNAPLIAHDAVSRWLDVVADVEGRPGGDVRADVAAALADLSFPLEYHAELSTAPDDAGAERRLAGAAALAAAVVVLLLLQAALGSWRLAAGLFLLLPAALAGGVLALALVPGDPPLVALAGLLAVLAAGVRGGLLVLRDLQALAAAEHERPGLELVLRATGGRVVPVLATAGAVALGLLPLVATATTAGTEVARPVAVVVLGGLVTSTLVVLLAVPALFLWLARGPHRPHLPGVDHYHGEHVAQRRPERAAGETAVPSYGDARRGVSASAEPRRGPGLAGAAGAGLLVLLLGAAGCGGTEPETSAGGSGGPEPATVTEVPGAGVSRVALVERAAERLDVQTAEATTGADGVARVPYAALIYDADGETWVYTSPERLVFQRVPVEVERIDGDAVVLGSGPAAGTPVVVVGAAELLGAELDVGH